VVAATLAADQPERVRGAVFLGHGLAVDPTQWIALVPGLGEWIYTVASRSTATPSPRRTGFGRPRLPDPRHARGARTFIRRQYTIDGLRLVTGTYEDIRVPVLQIHGSEDASIPIGAARELSSRLRDTRFVAVEGASHDVHVVASERVGRETLAFSASLAP